LNVNCRCSKNRATADRPTFIPYVGDFFGRGWVDAFLGPEAAMALGMRLDGAEFARVRVLAAPLEPVSIG
jgi:hypothetical protein